MRFIVDGNDVVREPEFGVAEIVVFEQSGHGGLIPEKIDLAVLPGFRAKFGEKIGMGIFNE
jgi:hypothetical protein